MATRTSKLKPTIAATPFKEVPVTPSDLDMRAQLHNMVDRMLLDGPSWKRQLIALTLGLVTTLATSAVVAQLVVYILSTSVMTSAFAVLNILVLVIGFALAIYLSSKYGMFVYARVIDESIDRAFFNAKDSVLRMFRKVPT